MAEDMKNVFLPTTDVPGISLDSVAGLLWSRAIGESCFGAIVAAMVYCKVTRVCDTGYFFPGLPIELVLVCTHLYWLRKR